MTKLKDAGKEVGKLCPKVARHRLSYLGLTVIYEVYLSYTCIALDPGPEHPDAPRKTIGTVNYQATEREIKSWIHGYINGTAAGFEDGVHTLRKNLKDALGIE